MYVILQVLYWIHAHGSFIFILNFSVIFGIMLSGYIQIMHSYF